MNIINILSFQNTFQFLKNITMQFHFNNSQSAACFLDKPTTWWILHSVTSYKIIQKQKRNISNWKSSDNSHCLQVLSIQNKSLNSSSYEFVRIYAYIGSSLLVSLWTIMSSIKFRQATFHDCIADFCCAT